MTQCRPARSEPPLAAMSVKLPLALWTDRYAAPLAPTTGAEMRALGWDGVDVVFVTGDAYVDHPRASPWRFCTGCWPAPGTGWRC